MNTQFENITISSEGIGHLVSSAILRADGARKTVIELASKLASSIDESSGIAVVGLYNTVTIDVDKESKSWQTFRDSFIKECLAAGWRVKLSQKKGSYQNAFITPYIAVKKKSPSEACTPDTSAGSPLQSVVESEVGPEIGTENPLQAVNSDDRKLYSQDETMDKIAAILAASEICADDVVHELISGMTVEHAAAILKPLGFERTPSTTAVEKTTVVPNICTPAQVPPNLSYAEKISIRA